MRSLATLILAVAVIGTACGGSDDSTATTTTSLAPTTTTTASSPATTGTSGTTTGPTPTTGPTTTSGPTTTTTSAAPTTTEEPGPRRIRVEVYDGLVAGEEHVVVDRGTEIEIVVVSDTADEVHLHGYDVKADVGPDADAVITLVADLPGIYEVELEDAGTLLFELEVR